MTTGNQPERSWSGAGCSGEFQIMQVSAGRARAPRRRLRRNRGGAWAPQEGVASRQAETWGS